METEQLFSGSKFAIINEISMGPKSASDIAKKLGTSIANIDQQLKLLEAYNIIKIFEPKDHQKEHQKEHQKDHEKDIQKDLQKEQQKDTQKEAHESKSKSFGKRKKLYQLNMEFAHFLIVKKGGVIKKTVPIVIESQKFLTNIFTLENQEDMFFLVKFCMFTNDILEKCTSMAVINQGKDNIELILLTDHLDEIRAKYSNTILKAPHGKEKKIVCWTHNENEIKHGLARKEKYFLNLLKDPKIIFDEESKLAELKKERDSMK